MGGPSSGARLMATLTQPPVPPRAPGPYRLSVGQYEAMIAAGIITDDDRVELIEGRLVAKLPKGPEHSTGSEKCWRAIDRALPGGWHVRIEKPVRLPARDSMPEPDISVVRGDVDDYAGRDPGPDDVALVVEVAKSSLADD